MVPAGRSQTAKLGVDVLCRGAAGGSGGGGARLIGADFGLRGFTASKDHGDGDQAECENA